MKAKVHTKGITNPQTRRQRIANSLGRARDMKKLFNCLFLLAFCQPLFAQEWTVELPQYKVAFMRDMIPVDSGEYVLGLGGNYYRGDGLILKVGKDGQYTDRKVHHPGMTLQYHSAIQLDNGNYMVFGICDDSLRDPMFQRYLQVDVFNYRLEMVSSMTYSVEDENSDYFYDSSFSYMMKSILSKNGTAILACRLTKHITNPSFSYYLCRPRFYEFDEAGGLLKMVDDNETVTHIEEIFYAPHSDNLMIAVHGAFPPNEGTGVYVVDPKLNIIARQDFYHLQGGPYSDHVGDLRCEGRWIDDECVIYDVSKSRPSGKDASRHTFYYNTLYKLDSALIVQAELRLPPYDSCTWSPEGTSTAYINDSTVFAFTSCSFDLFSDDVMQLNVILVDKDLNLLGRKVVKEDNVMLSSSTAPAAFNDGGCLAMVRFWNGSNYQGEPFTRNMLMKFRREDIEITWDVIQENKLSPSSIYPNPATNIINIPIDETLSDYARIQIFDAKGMKCLDSEVGDSGNLIKLDIRNLDAGLYVYKLTSNSQMLSSGKFIKE